jgi:hypothetical protein
VKYLFIAMDDDRRAHPEWLADDAAVLDAVKRAVWSGPVTDPDHINEAFGITATLIEDGYFPFEGDPPLHLFRLADGVSRPAGETFSRETLMGESKPK